VSRQLGSAKVVTVSLDEPLRTIEIEDRYAEVLFVITAGGAVIAKLLLPSAGTIRPELLRRIIAQQCGNAVWREQFRSRFILASQGDFLEEAAQTPPSLSVVVVTHRPLEELRACLESVLALDTAPREIVVVESGAEDPAKRALCEELSVAYAVEPTGVFVRARARGVRETTGELIGFLEDDCVVDRRWLDDLHVSFRDPIAQAVIGFVGPVELETPAQRLFQMHEPDPQQLEPAIINGLRVPLLTTAVQLAPALNLIIRRSAFPRRRPFPAGRTPAAAARVAANADLIYRILAPGNRVFYDPARIVWARYPAELRDLRRLLFQRTVAMSAFAAHILVGRRNLMAGRLLWRLLRHGFRELGHVLRLEERRLPLRAVVAETVAALCGPFALLGSKLRRQPEELVPPEEKPVPVRKPEIVSVVEKGPDVSIVVPSRNRGARLVKVLEHLADQTYPHERYELVVVLDGSTDDSAERVRSLELPYRIRVFEQSRGSAGATRNRGVVEAENPVVIMLDDDLYAVRDFIAAHTAFHANAREPHAIIGYSPPAVADTGIWAQVLTVWWQDHFRKLTAPNHRSVFTDFVTANVSMPRRVALQHPFDEAFPGRGREDWEIGLRLLQAGVKIDFLPEAEAGHDFDTRFTTAIEQQRKDAYLDYVFASRWPKFAPHLMLGALCYDFWLFDKVDKAAQDPEKEMARVRRMLPLINLFERLQMRGHWIRLSNKMQAEAYIVGLAQTFGSAENFMLFAKGLFEEADVADVTLDSRDGVSLRQETSEVKVEFGGEVVGRVNATEAFFQWDWDRITRTVVGNLANRAQELSAYAALEADGAVDVATELEELANAAN
jgi:glycosyltransferase involved in cell wall biosynthesis